MFKKILALSLVLALLVSQPITVQANEVVSYGGFTFTLIPGRTTITGHSNLSGEINLPLQAPDGSYVRAIGAGAFRASNVTRVNFPSNSQIDTIGTRAFQNSTLNRIDLPNSVVTIADEAFENSNLSQLTLSSNLEDIGRWSFSSTRLPRVTIPASVTRVGDNAFSHNSELHTAHFSHTDGRDVTMERNIFQSVHSGFRITHPPGASHFGANWYLPHDTVASDEHDALEADWRTTNVGANNLIITGIHVDSNLFEMERITIPSRIGGRNVVGIQRHSFRNMHDMREVVIPSSVTSIDARAFENNRNLRSAHFRHNDGNVIDMSTTAFVDSHASFTIFFPYGARGFATPTWHGFPAEAEGIEGLWETENISGTNALMITRYTGTAAIVEIPSRLNNRPVYYLGNEVFRDNNTVTEIIIPASIVGVPVNMVLNAPNLRVVRLLHMHADTLDFSGHAIQNVHRDFTFIFPANATGFTTPTWRNHPAEPDWLSANWEYEISGGAATITAYLGDEEHVEVPAYIGAVPVRVIASEAFRDNSTIQRVIIPASVTTIQANAFHRCLNLYSAKLLHTNANQIPHFSAESFVGVAAHFRIIFPAGAPGFTTPLWNGYFTMPDSDDLTHREGNFEYSIHRVPAGGIAGAMRDAVTITRYLGAGPEVEIPETLGGFPVVELGAFAFQQNLGIRRVIIPASVTTIGHSAFLGATNLEAAVFLHSNPGGIELTANTFRYTAANFTIMYPPTATGFTTPTWQDWPARPGTATTPALPPGGTLPGQEEPGDVEPGQLRNPFIHTNRTLDSQNPHMTRDGYVLQAPIFRLEPFAPNPQFSTSYVMVRVIADILGLDWEFNGQTQQATFSGYNAQNEFIVMALTINSTTMFVNGQPRDVRASAGVVPAISREGRIFVPVLVFQEVFGVTIQWNGANQTVTVNP